jgi:hypothetical protein
MSKDAKTIWKQMKKDGTLEKLAKFLNKERLKNVVAKKPRRKKPQ